MLLHPECALFCVWQCECMLWAMIDTSCIFTRDQILLFKSIGQIHSSIQCVCTGDEFHFGVLHIKHRWKLGIAAYYSVCKKQNILMWFWFMGFFFFQLVWSKASKKVVIVKMQCKVALFHYSSMVNSWLHKKLRRDQ